jgi:hypothetical protein
MIRTIMAFVFSVIAVTFIVAKPVFAQSVAQCIAECKKSGNAGAATCIEGCKKKAK